MKNGFCERLQHNGNFDKINQTLVALKKRQSNLNLIVKFIRDLDCCRGKENVWSTLSLSNQHIRTKFVVESTIKHSNIYLDERIRRRFHALFRPILQSVHVISRVENKK